MSQYFRAINKTKKQVVCPWCMGVDGNLKDEDVALALAAFVLLFRGARDGGGVRSRCSEMQAIRVDPDFSHEFSKILASGLKDVSIPELLPADSLIGQWAGDEVYLVSDDDCDLYQQSFWYWNISRELADTWNKIVDDKSLRLTWNVDCGCTDFADAHR